MLGSPVSHSLSPLIQNTALQLLGESLVYLATDVRPQDFLTVIRALPTLRAVGANVTVPHKLMAFEACDVLSERAKAIGAVNVLSFRDGRVFGDNTDGVGWLRALPEGWLRQDSGFRVIVLGAGGAARAVVSTLVSWGCPEIVVLNRTLERAESLVADFESLAGEGVRLSVAGLGDFQGLLQQGGLVVQTTSVGLCRTLSPVVLSGDWPEGANFSELIYGEPTPMANWVSSQGGGVQDGLPMLIHQAAESLSIWLERPLDTIPAAAMLQVARESLAVS